MKQHKTHRPFFFGGGGGFSRLFDGFFVGIRYFCGLKFFARMFFPEVFVGSFLEFSIVPVQCGFGTSSSWSTGILRWF